MLRLNKCRLGSFWSISTIFFSLIITLSLDFSVQAEPGAPYRQLPLESLPTDMALTEDGKFLVVACYQDDLLVVWDVVGGQVVAKDAKCPSPKYILCRGDRIFVANHGEGTIRVYSQQAEFRLVDELSSGGPDPVHLSAPQGKYFQGELLVTCGDDGGSSYYLVDVEQDERQRIPGTGRRAYTDYRGRFVFLSGLDRTDYRAEGTAVFRYEDFPKDDRIPIHFDDPGGDLRTIGPATQAHPDDRWVIGSRRAHGMLPSRSHNESAVELAAIDHCKPLAYEIRESRHRGSRQTLAAFGDDTWATLLGTHEIAWPEDLSTPRGTRWTRHQFDVENFTPTLAVTHGDQLMLFVLHRHHSKGAVLQWTLPSLEKPAAAGSFPRQIVAGEPFAYRLPPSDQGVASLRAGPQGASLEESVLRWTPQPEDTGAHRFRIVLTSGDELSSFNFEVEVVSPDLADKLDHELGATTLPGKHPLTHFTPHVTTTDDGDAIMVLQGTTLRFLNQSGFIEKSRAQLPEAYTVIEARKEYYVALAMRFVDLLDKESFEVVQRIDLPEPYVYTYDMAIHPDKPICYVTAVRRDDLFSETTPEYASRLILLDERGGKSNVLDEVVARWLAVDPQGTYLYASIPQREKFHPWLMNLHRRRLSDDATRLTSLRISRTAAADIRRCERNIKGGFGLRIAPDGAHVVHLCSEYQATPNTRSEDVLPVFSRGKIAAADLHYALDHVDDLAFHPTLDLVAVSSGNSILFIERSTGKQLEDKLAVKDDALRDIGRIYFAPDGRHLLVVGDSRLPGDTSSWSRRMMQSFPLNLTDEELNELNRR